MSYAGLGSSSELCWTGWLTPQTFLFLSLESERPHLSALIDSVSGEGHAWAACCCLLLCPHRAEKEVIVSSFVKKF